MTPIDCLDCERRKNQLYAQLEVLRKKVKILAIETYTTYCIYLDKEDQKLGYTAGATDHPIIEYVSKYP